MLFASKRLCANSAVPYRSLREPPKTTRPNGAAAPKRAARSEKVSTHGFKFCRLPNRPVAALLARKARFQLQIGTTPISQVVRFARPNIQFYDGHVIDLYQLICAPYLIA